MRMERRWKLVALLATGIAIGVLMMGTPAAAHVGGTVNHLWNHLKPKADKRYVKKTAIATIQGNYAVGGNTSNDAWSEIDFGFQLASAPVEHFIPQATAPPAQCPGSAVNPRAQRGHLCVYEAQSANRLTLRIFTGTTGGLDQASRWGAGLWLRPTAAGDYFSYGTWAVTAPAGTSPKRVANGGSSGATAGE